MESRKKVNYLEHETEVKYMDGILDHSQEWQWLIDIIIERFELSEVDSWEEFIEEKALVLNVFRYFVNVLKVCNKDWDFSKNEFKEIWIIARYYVGNIDECSCSDAIRLNLCKLFYVGVWIAKLENCDNDTKYLYDARFLTQRNVYQLINCDSMFDNGTEITNYINEIQVTGREDLIKCFADNLEQKEYPCNVKFLQCHEKEILNYNSFFYQLVNKSDCETWQEEYLLDMLNISFKDKSIRPAIVMGDSTTPDISLWTNDLLCDMKTYFHHATATFVIESISYVLYDQEPSIDVKLCHCKLLLDKLNIEASYKIFNSSSYIILSYLFKDKLMNDCSQNQIYLRFLQTLHEWKDPQLITQIKEDGYPITKEQGDILTLFLREHYKGIESVGTIEELLDYLEDSLNSKQITTEYLGQVNEKFIEETDYCKGIEISKAYLDFMKFLFHVRDCSRDVDKRYVYNLMIQLQEKWQKDIYEQQVKNLQTIPYQQKVSKAELEDCSDKFILDPIYFANGCMPCSENKILDIMDSIADAPFMSFISMISITPEFPIDKETIDFDEKHKINQLFRQIIDEIKQKKGYRLRNILDTDKFVEGVFDRYEMNTYINAMLFIKDEELYNVVNNEISVDLIPYSDKISLAMVTQLFPVLEMNIRQLSKLFGIFPFKEEKKFMQYNDPSTLLINMLGMIYDVQESFESVPDLFFVYNAMYNGNFLNIRNECIHGRLYLQGNGLKFAFKVTLFAIHMVVFRIKTIKDNVSDLEDVLNEDNDLDSN